jgi:hypothetical protein
VWIGVTFVRDRSVSLREVLTAGGLAGCAALTKGTALAFALVLAIAFAIGALMIRIRLPLALSAAGVVVAAAIAMPHYLPRLNSIVRSESGGGSNHANAQKDVISGTSVLIRNAAIQFAMPAAGINESILEKVVAAHEVLGVDTNDPNTTFSGARFAIDYNPTHEDLSNAPIQFAFLILAPFVFACIFGVRSHPAGLLLALSGLAMVIVFSILFKWQPWHSRLLIPCFAVASIPFGIVADRARALWRTVPFLAVVAMGAWLWPSLSSLHRPLAGAPSVLLAGGARPHIIDDLRGELLAPAVAQLVGSINPDRIILESRGGPVHALTKAISVGGAMILAPQATEASQADLWVQVSAPWEPLSAKLPNPFPPTVPPKHLIFDAEGVRIWASGTIQATFDPPLFALPSGSSGLGPIQLLDRLDSESAFRHGYYPEIRIPIDTSASGGWILQGEVVAFKRGNRVRIEWNGVLQEELVVPASGKPVEFDVLLDPRSFPAEVVLKFDEGNPSEYEPYPVGARFFRLQLVPNLCPE